MHGRIKTFLKEHKHLCVEGDQILDVGSFNVNGSVSKILPVTKGVDMREGKGVDLVCKGEDLLEYFEKESFDIVTTCDTLEHVEYWRPFLQGMWSVLKVNGYFIGTIASTRKSRHAYPDDYWRLNKGHLEEIFGTLVDFQELGISTGWVVQKLSSLPLMGLDDIHLLPVDTSVPKALLKRNPNV